MKEEVIDGKRVWTYSLKELVGDDPLVQIYDERQKEWRKMLKEGKTREEIEAYMATTDYEERIEKIVYPRGKKKEPEIEIGQRVAVFEIVGKLVHNRPQSYDFGRPIIDGKHLFARLLIKRIGYKTYLGGGLWALEFDNATEEEITEYMEKHCSGGETYIKK